MTLEHYANVAEIIGALVVVVTVVFLALQVRRNTQSLRSTATQTAHQELSELYNTFLEDPSFLDLWMRATEDPSALSNLETARLNAWWMKGSLSGQNWYLQTKVGAIEPTMWRSYAKLIHRLCHTEMYKQFWSERKFVFAPEYVKRIEKMMSEPASAYAPLGVTKAKSEELG